MSDTTPSEVRIETIDAVRVITIDRPTARNTVTYGVLDELLAAFADADVDDSVRVIIVTGAGEFFSAGSDLSSSSGYAADRTDFKPLRGGTRDVGGELALRIFDSNKPVIAAINGTAVGIGVSMILPMDIRIASDTARFGLPFVRRGILPESCATWFLPRIVGIDKALDLFYSADILTAEQALEYGLVREVVAEEELLPAAYALADRWTRGRSAVSTALMRQMAYRNSALPDPYEAHLVDSLAMFYTSIGDGKEGV
ncbi:MAG: enoyl-CoA hydratase-related protein, partial [Actinomycetota bacterium]